MPPKRGRFFPSFLELLSEDLACISFGDGVNKQHWHEAVSQKEHPPEWMIKKEKKMNAVLERLKEPSSWAGLGGLLAMVGVSLDPGVLHGLSLVGAGVAWVAAFFVPEK